ncbi:MAG: hypothetical protein IK121_10755, partial [Lachnospiraceae bacterium]|nr:hypothetical protein [Lachnospiraceae bacterium]
MDNFKKALTYDFDREIPYLMHMATTGAIGIKTYEKIKDKFLSPKEFYEANEKTLESLKLFPAGRLSQVIKSRKDYDPRREYERLLKENI